MAHILVITEVFYPEYFLINDLVEHWMNKGYEVDVISQYPSYPYGHVFDSYTNKHYVVENWKGVNIYRFPFVPGYNKSMCKKIANYLYFIWGGFRIIRKMKSQYDFVFVSQTGPLTVSVPGIYAKYKFKCPLLIWVFDLWPDTVYAYGLPKNWITDLILRAFVRYVYRASDSVLVASKGFLESIDKQLINKPLRYIPNWRMNSKSEMSTLRLPKDKINYVFTGNLSKAQNLDTIIKAFAKANLSDALLHLVGVGSAQLCLKKLTKSLGMEGRVLFHGRYPSSQIHDILKQSDYLILPLLPNPGINKTEPLKLQSYLAANKPIIAVLSGYAAEIIEDHNLGLTANPENMEEIVDVFSKIRVFNYPANAGLDLLSTRFNRASILSEIDEIVHSVFK